MVEPFDIWLSARQIRRYTARSIYRENGDFGCGYNATIVRSALPELGHAVLVDLVLSPELKNLTEDNGDRRSTIGGPYPTCMREPAYRAL
jgi:hypothetical protein